jgi:hypothetical protein
MRLWSIHPKYLDSIGLVALWREGLLAKKVLQGKTKGYRHHPQLERFRGQQSPVASINRYLCSVWEEAALRGFSFDRRKLGNVRRVPKISVSLGQLRFELGHLLKKLRTRNKKRFRLAVRIRSPLPHPLFKRRRGGVEAWERLH